MENGVHLAGPCKPAGKRLTTSLAEHHENQQLLTPAQEDTLLKHIDTLHKRGLPPTRYMIRNLAVEIVQKPVGRNWVDRFLHRHSDKVFKKFAQGMDTSRKRADSAFKYSLYFDLLERKI